MTKRSTSLCIGIGLLLLVAGSSPPATGWAADRPAKTAFQGPGSQADGAVLLPNQWYLRPVGRQIPLGDFPVNIALHKGGRYAAVLHCGYGQHEIITIDVAAERIVSRVPVMEAFYGLAFTDDGRRLFCSGAGAEVVYSFEFRQGYLTDRREHRLRPARQRGIVAGVVLHSGGQRLYAANLVVHSVTELDLAKGLVSREIQLGRGEAAPVPAEIGPARGEDEASITKRAEAMLYGSWSDDPYPYACVLDEEQSRLYVSYWAQAVVGVIDLRAGALIGRWATEEHPNEMVLSRSGRHLYVANANRNSVSVLDTRTGKTLEVLRAELTPHAPPGNTPNSLALSPDQKLLFVANANINTVAVFEVSEPGRSRPLGFIPVGWYPTSVRVSPDGKKLLVANGKGLISKANRSGPRPGAEPPATVREYIGGLMQGTLSVIDLPPRGRLEEFLNTHTAQAYRCLPDPASTVRREADNPIPLRVGDPSPIQYVVYILKENRTYDQVLGDMPEGRGDPSLCLFPERVTPNHHRLAREFVLLDNFYVESEVSADGHEWSMGAYATDFVEKTWPLSYGHNSHKKYAYPSEGSFPIATPAGGYLWDRAREAGISYRSYGEFVANGASTNAPGRAKVPALRDHFDPWFRSFDMDYSDLLRAQRFISELRRFEGEGEMPRLQILRLPNDHTAGTVAGKLTPTAYVAENDVAFGQVVEAISQSRFWPKTAIFVVEDDAQNGSDHVDAHRTIAYVISPYARRGGVDSTLYSTASMLRTMELILGLRPMSQFDAVARPMYGSFQGRADPRPYRHSPANVDIGQRNMASAWGSRQSSEMDFSKEDAADDLQLNEVIWRSVRGAESPMPPPVRAAFVRPSGGDRDDR
jgi:DNA-binding beta-propeller fold protein YncE